MSPTAAADITKAVSCPSENRIGVEQRRTQYANRDQRVTPTRALAHRLRREGKDDVSRSA